MYRGTGNELLNAEAVLKKIELGPGMRIADLGCGGIGHFVIPAGKIVTNSGIVYAVDVLKSVLHSVAARARSENLNNVKTVWSNLEVAGATRITPNSLDRTLLINILFQSEKDEAIIREASRLTKQGGKLMVIDWKPDAQPLGPPADKRIGKDTVKNYAQNHDFELLDEFDAGQYHYGLIFTKQ